MVSMVHRLSRRYGEHGNTSDVASLIAGFVLYFIGGSLVDSTGIPAASMSIRNLYRITERVRKRLRPSVEAEWIVSTGFVFGRMLGSWAATVGPAAARPRSG
jgi:hypothetical protein